VIRIRKGSDRGRFDHGWLDTRHTFSFGEYFDPEHSGFRSLRVLNEDRVKPGKGFGKHSHRDMEIVTYVVSGALAHEDSLGHGRTIRRGEVQRMTAGTGVVHSEFNASRDEDVHFLQIWIRPERKGLAPGYEQNEFPDASKRGRLRLVASRGGRDGSLTVNQDVDVLAALVEKGRAVEHALEPGRHAWLQVVRGAVEFAFASLEAGDGAAVSDETALSIAARGDDAEILLFDLA